MASKNIAAAVIIAGVLAGIGNVKGSDLSLRLTGDVLGTVVDGSGTPQMGATVQIFNKYQHFIARTLTAPDGRFAFAGLPADLYSVHVSLSSYLPAARDKVVVKAGLNSILQIHLATLFSNIEVSYTVPTAAMSDDWKWVLRSSPATRPVTRLVSDETQPRVRPRVFSETHAMLSVSGGDGGLIDSGEIGADLGTGFALSTNILGKNQLQFAGAFGQNAELGPAALALCAIYSRTDNGPITSPEITLTVAQIGGVGAQLVTGAATSAIPSVGTPLLRTMSLSFYQVADPLDNVHLEYGMTGESVDYVQHTNRISPFARATVELGSSGSVIAAYSDGGRPDELTAHQQYQAAALDAPGDDLTAAVGNLARMPQISDRNGQLELQRTQNYEVGYQKTQKTRTYSLSSFYEHVSNGRLNVAGDLSELDSGDLLSDGISTTSALNIGSYDRLGYVASVNQRLNESLDMSLAYGRMDGFTVAPGELGAGTWNTNARFLNEGQHNIASADVKATVHRFGTRISTNYGWMDARTAVPRHVFTTQDLSVAPGLNILVRQPLPSFFGFPGHLELTGDLRNLLAQGYVPVDGVNGHRLVIVEAPRAIRGGLSFTF